MKIIISSGKWIMLICGILTCSMLLGVISPGSFLQSNFGTTTISETENLVVRSWSALIGLMGIMLIYGAVRPKLRSYALVWAGISKIIFIACALAFGKQYMQFGLGTAVVVDTVMILFFAVYLSQLAKTPAS